MSSKKPNFSTILNIPDEIKRFNHLQFMLELGGMGEGYIPLIKKKSMTYVKILHQMQSTL